MKIRFTCHLRCLHLSSIQLLYVKSLGAKNKDNLSYIVPRNSQDDKVNTLGSKYLEKQKRRNSSLLCYIKNFQNNDLPKLDLSKHFFYYIETYVAILGA